MMEHEPIPGTYKRLIEQSMSKLAEDNGKALPVWRVGIDTTYELCPEPLKSWLENNPRPEEDAGVWWTTVADLFDNQTEDRWIKNIVKRVKYGKA